MNMANMAKTQAGPIDVNSAGTMAGIIAANHQWTEVPKACPLDLR